MKRQTNKLCIASETLRRLNVRELRGVDGGRTGNGTCTYDEPISPQRPTKAVEP